MAAAKKKPAPKKPAPKKPAPKKPAPKKQVSGAVDLSSPSTFRGRPLLADLVSDSYFPAELVAKGQAILWRLAARIEAAKPKGTAVYALTHEAVEAFNALAEELEEAGSDLETAARENIAMDVDFILQSFGYEVPIEDAIANRTW